MFRKALTFTLALGLLWFGGCSKSDRENGSVSSGTPIDLEKKTVAILVQTTANPFFNDFAEAARAELGEDYDVVIVGGDNDADTQAKQIRDFIVQGVDALLITPCNANAVGTQIREANRARIPVFTADTAVLDENVDILCHVATDNYGGGKLAGQAMLEALNHRGGKIMVLHFEQAQSCQARVQGFTEVINAHNADPDNRDAQITIIGEYESMALEKPAYDITTDVLKANRDLVGVFAINDPAALGAVKAIEEDNLQDQIKVIGFDGQKIGKLAIRDGRIFADPVQYPEQMGQKVAAHIKDYFRGIAPPKLEEIPAKLYYKADADQDPDLVE